jgi:hypothetical protein
LPGLTAPASAVRVNSNVRRHTSNREAALTKEFHFEEYKQLREEVKSLLARIELLFRYSIIVSAVVYSWLALNTIGTVLIASKHHFCLKYPFALVVIGWLIPVVFVACMAVMAKAAGIRVTETGEYLAKLEQHLGESKLGWETHLKRKAGLITGTTSFVWLLLFLATALATTAGLREVRKLNDDPAKVCAPAK